MAIQINHSLTSQSLRLKIENLFRLSVQKIVNLQQSWNPAQGTPVFTVEGKYTSRGWTEWTQGFQFGSELLQYDATGERAFLDLGRDNTVKQMASHVSHIGVHDHGFNNISTYGNLWRLMGEGRIAENARERDFLELALKVSGAVQAARWTSVKNDSGFIHSFNGPHSLFIDTIRSLRSLAVAHQLGHVLMGEGDRRISLLDRLIQHARTTAQYSVYYGEGRDTYNVRGRTAHESVFNVNDGNYRCPNSQQGYSPFTTWTRGLAWAICGFAEQLEWLRTLHASQFDSLGGWENVRETLEKAASAVSEFYLRFTPTCGIPYWDTGAPGLRFLGDYLNVEANPFNNHEPVDSSAAAIAAQGLYRFGRSLGYEKGGVFRQAALTIANTLFQAPYLSEDMNHQGLILHSVYHRPNGWDHIAPGQKVPNGESSMWGDYHARELALLLLREARGENYLTFFGA